jgi:PAS domain-containing protein
MVGAGIFIWTRHLDVFIEYSRKGIQAAVEVGNATWGSFNYAQLVLGLIVRGDPLKDVYTASQSAMDYALRAKLLFVGDVITSMQRLVQAMRGLSDHFATQDGDGFREQDFEAYLEEKSFPTVRLIYQVMKPQARILANQDEDAFAAAVAAERDLSGASGMIILAEYHYFAALATASHLSKAPADAEADLRRSLARHQEQLRIWTETCPDNFAGKHALVSAEIARLTQRPMDAAALYDQAILAFRRSGFSHQEALASELAARFYLDRGFANLPGLYLREALSAYSRWGASGKVGQLEQRYARILDQEQRRATSRSQLSMAAEEFDAQAAFKVSRALSGEMTPQQMMSTLMRLVIEHAGAERCCLLLGEDLWIAAEANVSKSGVDIGVFERGAVTTPDRVPMSIINYVRRTRERLLLNDTAEVAAFAADEYLRRERPKSVLCLPLMKGPGALGGVLYLENKLVQGAFIPRRLTLLEFLAVISLQNAVLREELARESAERKQAEETLRRSEERLRMLAEAANVSPQGIDAPGRREEQTKDP